MTSLLPNLSKAWRPPPILKVSEWADEYRFLSPEASAEPGKWDTSRAEYQRGIMDALNDRTIEQVVVMTSSQIGKTEIELNTIGYYMSQDPSPLLVVYPTETMAEAFSDDRLTPMIRDTPVMHGLIQAGKKQGAKNTKLHKQFPGGHITMVGSNSPSNLAVRPIRVVLFDEVDRFPQSSGGKESGEGDVISLASKRTKTYFNRKIIMVSTPTVKGLSRIEMAYEESDQRKYFVPCPHCGEPQELKWSNVTWSKDDAGKSLPKTAAYACGMCGVLWSEKERHVAVRRGRWVAARPGGKVAGFHLSELYSPWSTLSGIVEDFLRSKASPERLRAWINTTLGEVFEESGDSIDITGLFGRREDYAAVPASVGALVASVDVQDDRLEYLLTGFAENNEVYAFQYGQIHGDPALPEVWADLDTVIFSRYQTSDGGTIPVACTLIDTGGHKTQAVYDYLKPRQGRRVYGLKGSSTISNAARPLVPSKSKMKGGVIVFQVATDTGKDILFARLNIDTPGPAYIHFNRSFPEDFFIQFSAEKRVIRYYKGFPRREYQKVSARNEAIDLMVYAFAAFEVLNVKSIKKLVNARAQVKDEPELIHELIPEPSQAELSIKPRKTRTRKGGNFATSW